MTMHALWHMQAKLCVEDLQTSQRVMASAVSYLEPAISWAQLFKDVVS